MWNFFFFVFIVGVFGDFALSFQHTHTEYEGFDSLCPISLSFKGRKTSIFGICSEILVKDKLRGQSILSSGSGSNFFWKCRIRLKWKRHHNPGPGPIVFFSAELWNRYYFLRFRFLLLKSYGSGYGSGFDFWKAMIPVPVPTFEKLRFRFQLKF
jgi:hypothetical protein